MNVRLIPAILMALMWMSQPVAAQGYGGLGTKAEGYDVPQRGTQLQFPRDHGAHPGYRIEWWYLTANLQGEDGRQYGVQWTLFRSALQPPQQAKRGATSDWHSTQLWMGHAAITTPDSHHVAESLARGAYGLAGVQAAPFKAWINDWEMSGDGGGGASKGVGNLALSASGTDFGYRLALSSDGPLIFHGDQGYSVKSASGQASYYYSQPFYQVQGQLELPSGSVSVTGNAWLDREWSSQPLSEDQQGWDWVSLSFDDGSKLMGFQLRQSDGNNFTSATWIQSDGQTTAYANNKLKMTEISRSNAAGREVPTRWRVELPERGVDVTVQALNKDAWMETSFPYWEGPVNIKGSHAGVGYLEMTGYQ
ncbi:MAG: iron ABC transporter permease [Rhizobiaceae bacterium]|nr:iron ABC transporter permease [Rhizobiaceae bacterium]